MFLQIKSPSPVDVWRDAIRNHPDSALATYLLHDVEYGVLIGFHGERTPMISSNHFSSLSEPEIIAKELEPQLFLTRNA